MDKINKFMIYTFSVMILFVSVCFLIPGSKEESQLVKGNLKDTEEIEDPILKFQAELENNIVLKFPFYEDILKGYFGFTAKMNENLSQNANDNELILVDKKNEVYRDNKKEQLIRKYTYKNPRREVENRVKLFNDAYKIVNKNGSNMYIYAVSNLFTSEAILNFDLELKDPLKYPNMFKESINKGIKFDELKIIDFTTYKEYFLKTDHHWRIQGGYQAYLDLFKLMEIKKQEDLIPGEFFKVKGVEFQGSNARICAYDDLYDDLYDIKFDKNYKVKVDGKEAKVSELSAREEYLKGKIPDEEYYNHYGKYFHSDKGEIVYDFSDVSEEDRKLLIISDSYSNNMEKLIASHFDKTYAIDLRFYESAKGEKFILDDYIKENKITDVLFILSSNSIYYESTEIELK